MQFCAARESRQMASSGNPAQALWTEEKTRTVYIDLFENKAFPQKQIWRV